MGERGQGKQNMSKGTETRVCGYGEGKGAYSIATKWSLYMKLECPFLLGKELNLKSISKKAFQTKTKCVRERDRHGVDAK